MTLFQTILIISALTASVAAEELPLVVEDSTGYWEWSRNDPPEYPKGAIRSRTTGFVSVVYTINSKGRIQDIEIMESEPEGVFDKATLRALRKVRFRPTDSNQKRQPVRVPFTMKFNLHGNGP